MGEGLLGDNAGRDYSRKLRLFNSFAEPELRQAIVSLGIEPGMRILDAGCGTGEALRWLRAAVGDAGEVTGIDLSSAHVAEARRSASDHARILQADLQDAPLGSASHDLVWSVNTINHLRDPVSGLMRLAALVRPGGRVALGQSSLLPDMCFAWDARLERVTNEAVRRYYRVRYGVSEQDLAGVRSLVGWLRQAGLHEVTVRTLMLDRTSPLDPATETYLAQVLFQGTWGERLRPYLSDPDYRELQALCDPAHSGFALRRPDFHFLQTFTLAVGRV